MCGFGATPCSLKWCTEIPLKILPPCRLASGVWVSRRRHRFWHATLRLRSAIHWHHPPQRTVLSQICCFGERKVVLFQILLDGAEPRDAGTTWLFSPACWRILFASALSSMHIICPSSVSRRDWIIAVSLGCFHTSSFRSNWYHYHLMPSSIHRHHRSSAPILRASVFDIAQQSEPFRNIGIVTLQLCWGSEPWPPNLIF